MRVISIEEFLNNIQFFKQEALNKKIFIYPTDTIYGIGGLFPTTLEQIYTTKKRPFWKPVSVIIPSLKFVAKLPVDFSKLGEVDNVDKLVSRLSTLLSTYWKQSQGVTFVLPLRHPLRDVKFEQAYNLSLGVRVLNHPIQRFFGDLDEMFVTTSANLAGQPVIKAVGDIPFALKSHIDWIIDWGELQGSPSVILDAQKDFEPILRT